jgi:DNA-binding NarL/FixJ family response regulator
VRSAAAAQAQLVVLGSHGDQPIGDTVRRAKQLPQAPDVVVLLEQTDREELTMLLGAGVDALLVRCIGEAELGDALARLLAGERVVSPALLPILVGVMDLARRDGDQDGLLTSKEREVLARLAEGRSNQSIAAALSVTPATVKTHLAHIYEKLGAQNRHDALHRAVALGLLT